MRHVLILALIAPLTASASDFGQWTVEGPGAAVSVSRGSFHATYDSPEFRPVTLRPAAPIPLPEDVQRVQVWWTRVSGDFDVQFVLRDGEGKEHAARSHTSQGWFPAIRRFKLREWSLWNQATTVNLGIPAPLAERVQPEFMPVSKATLWPRPLALTGIMVKPARDWRDNVARGERDAIRSGKGALVLTDLTVCDHDGFEAGNNWYLAGRWRWGWDTVPRIFLDDLTRASGPMRFAVQVRKGYQGPVVWRMDKQAKLDRGKPMQVFADRVELPELPKGTYFIETKAWRKDGALDAVRKWRHIVIKSSATKSPGAEAPFAWHTGHEHHVFPPHTTRATVALRVASAAWPRGSKCTVQVRDWLSRPVHEQAFDRAQELVVTCPVAEGTDYRAAAEWRVGAKVLDRTELHFGVANKPFEPGSIPDGLPTRDDLLMSKRPVALAEHWGSLMSTRFEWEPITVERAHQFDQWLADVQRLKFGVVSIAFGWGEVEALPGVFRWSELERRVKLIEAAGLKVLLTPTEWGHPLGWPRWLDYAPTLDQHGRTMKSNWPPASFRDPVAYPGEAEWYRAVARRFRHSPTVIGYRTKPPIYHGTNKPEFLRADYSQPMLDDFDKWQRGQGLDPCGIPKLFLLYPYSPHRTGPDLSPPWTRFCEFRIHSYVQAVERIMNAFRSVDPKRQIHIYRSSMPTACEAAIPLLRDGGEFHDEGGPFYFQRAVESMCLQAGVPYTNEGHQFTPPSKALVDAGFLYGSAYDNGWFWLYRWHVDRHRDKRFAALPQVLEFIRDSMPAMREWVAADGDEPEVLVFGSRAEQLLWGGRQGFYSNIAGLPEFTALYCYHQLPAHFADEHTGWVDPSRFRLAFAVGDVMHERAVGRLVAHAKAGGRLVLVGDAGKYCVEEPAERDLLRKRVAGLPNVRSIPAAANKPPAPGAAYRTKGDFDPEVVDDVLSWAGVARLARTSSPAFECLRKRSPDGRTIYVATYRRWPGNYNNAWYDDRLAKHGREACELTVAVPSDGLWRVEKFHRNAKTVGLFTAAGRRLRFPTDPATMGELQLFRVRR